MDDSRELDARVVNRWAEEGCPIEIAQELHGISEHCAKGQYWPAILRAHRLIDNLHARIDAQMAAWPTEASQ